MSFKTIALTIGFVLLPSIALQAEAQNNSFNFPLYKAGILGVLGAGLSYLGNPLYHAHLHEFLTNYLRCVGLRTENIFQSPSAVSFVELYKLRPLTKEEENLLFEALDCYDFPQTTDMQRIVVFDIDTTSLLGIKGLGLYEAFSDYIFLSAELFEKYKHSQATLAFILIHEIQHYKYKRGSMAINSLQELVVWIGAYLVMKDICKDMQNTWLYWLSMVTGISVVSMTSELLTENNQTVYEETRADVQTFKIMNCGHCIKEAGQRYADKTVEELAAIDTRGYKQHDIHFIEQFLKHHDIPEYGCKTCRAQATNA